MIRPLLSVFVVVAFASPMLAADFFSFENGVEGWTADDGLSPQFNPAIASKTAAEGVPAGAITDGTHALELTSTGNGNWSQRVRLVSSLINVDLAAHTTMEFDLYIPASTVPTDAEIAFDPINNPNNKFYQFEISIEGGIDDPENFQTMNYTEKYVQDGFDFLPGATPDLPKDTSIHIVYEYALKPQWIQDADWSQVTFNSQLGDQFGDLDDPNLSTSPWYIDNFQLTGGGTPGDFDEDDDVDGGDFLEWQRDQTGRDLADWEANFGSTSGTLSGIASIPEPSSLALVAMFAALRWIRPRR